MPKKPNRKTVVKNLDKIVSKIVVKRDERCVTCGTTQKLGCGHLFSRVAYSTRWDTKRGGNCSAQCWPENFRHEFDPFEYTNWYIKKYGKKAYEELHRRFKTPVRYTTAELNELYERLKKEYEAM